MWRKAALNDALGLPLDAAARSDHARSTPLDLPDLTWRHWKSDASADAPGGPPSRTWRRTWPRRRRTRRAAPCCPQVGFHAAFEADRQQFIDKGGANWLASVGLRLEPVQRLRRQGAHRGIEPLAGARAKPTSSAWIPPCAWRCAAPGPICAPPQQRIEVAKAAVAEAEESLRITQNRYEAGMSNVTDLLRNETAVLESRTRYLAAVHDQRIAATMLELAAGRLSRRFGGTELDDEAAFCFPDSRSRSRVLAGCGGEPPQPEAACRVRAAVAVQTAAVAPQQWPDVYEATGTVRARTAAVISSKVMGYVREVAVQVGDRVSEGQLLVTLDARDLDANVRRAEAGRPKSGAPSPKPTTAWPPPRPTWTWRRAPSSAWRIWRPRSRSPTRSSTKPRRA